LNGGRGGGGRWGTAFFLFEISFPSPPNKKRRRKGS